MVMLFMLVDYARETFFRHFQVTDRVAASTPGPGLSAFHFLRAGSPLSASGGERKELRKLQIQSLRTSIFNKIHDAFGLICCAGAIASTSRGTF
jgi:hypothetical protein